MSAGNLSSSYALKVDLDTNCTGGAGSHNIVLGAGNDTVIAELDDLDTSTLTITGGSGTDTLQITDAGDASAYNVFVTLDRGITGFETLAFTTASDTYKVTTHSDTVASGATLTVSGASLTGVLYFDGSAETNGYFSIASGGGNDSLTGGTLADTISAGSGVDTITGGLGADSITGGAGNDVFVYANVSQSGGTAVDTITDWTSAADKLQVTLDYSAQSAALDINAVRLGTGAAALSNIQDGLSGKRGEYQYNVETSQVVINFNNDNLITSSDYKIGLVAGSTATATVADGDINFVISGGTAADSIIAGGGADTISGGSGADTITGGAGADFLYGDNTGAKEVQTITITGTTGGVADAVTIVYQGHTYATATLATTSTVSDIAAAVAAKVNSDAFSTGRVVAQASNGVVTLTSLIDSNIAAVTYTSGNLTGLTGTIATSTAGTAGDNSADSITGGTGNDVIYGGSGADTIVLGDGGVDRLTFSSSGAANGADVISGFDTGSAGDVLDFSLFIGGSSTVSNSSTSGVYAATTYATASATAVTITGKIAILKIASGGTTFDTAGVLAAIGDALSSKSFIVGDGKAIVIAGETLSSVAYVYMVDQDLGTLANAIDSGDVVLVGTITGTADLINTIHGNNIAFG